jgi:RNA polymerase sigma-70 factor (ECF subfamily)
MILEPDTNRWFSENVQPHEPMLRAWLHSRFPSGCDIDDLVQESFMRVLQARERGVLRSPKAFLFATARNLALDQLRHRRVARTESLVEIEALAVLDEADGVSDTVALNQELALLTEAIQSLPDRCRQIFTLRKIYGMSQKDIATRLALSEHTVSAQLTIGLHKCTEFFWRHRAERTGRL